jgi:predicted MFS family arabinose efflux permease
MKLVLRVFLPFAAGFALSYLCRVINAAIARDLLRDLAIDAAGLGLMTSVFFFVLMAMQVPMGAALDRFGPRRVQATLLPIAALGAVVFAFAQCSSTAMIGRTLIAIGVAVAFPAALKATAVWFPKDRLASVNGWTLTAGGLGAVTATGPTDLAVRAIGWRGVFIALALLILLAACATWLVVPECSKPEQRPPARRSNQLFGVFRDRDFLCVAPLIAVSIGNVWALQSLWVEHWLADVELYDCTRIATHLSIMACSCCAGGVAFGTLADRLGSRGIKIETVLSAAILAMISIECLVLLRPGLPSYFLWGGIAIFGNMNSLGYAIIAELFPREHIGKANAALILLIMFSAFVFQSSTGYILGLWSPNAAGHYPLIAYRAAFCLPLLLQGLAFSWFVCENLRRQRFGLARAIGGSEISEPRAG